MHSDATRIVKVKTHNVILFISKSVKQNSHCKVHTLLAWKILYLNIKHSVEIEKYMLKWNLFLIVNYFEPMEKRKEKNIHWDCFSSVQSLSHVQLFSLGAV